MADSAGNVFSNIILPVDPRKSKVLVGTAQYVALEVLVSKLARRFIKSENKSFTELIFIHTLSLPFMGGAVGFVAPNSDFKDSPAYGELFTDGAKGIPAVLLAQWVLNTFAKGLHFPWFNMRELMIVAGAKLLTRPIAGALYPYMPASLQDGNIMINSVIKRQAEQSSFAS
jgi:hypothetical protein